MPRLLNIPLSVVILFFGYVLLYLGAVGSMGTVLAIVGGVMIPILALLVWLDFARPSAPGRRSRAHRGQ